MNSRARSLTFAFASFVIVVVSSACGGGSDKTGTPTREGTPATTSSVVATSSLGIRTLDLSSVQDVQDLEASTGGAYVETSALYADLNGDGVDDAVVPISSGGTQGDIAFLVLAPDGDGTRTLLEVAPSDGEGGLSVAIVGGQLVMTRPVYGPDDPNCCPSALRKTTYTWDGSAFAEESTTEENPDGGGAKRTPVPPEGSQ